MKKLLIIFIFILSSQGARAQSFSASPTSITLLGTMDYTYKLTATYYDISVIVLGTWQQGELKLQKTGKDAGYYGGVYIGLFWTPINFSYKNFELNAGAGVFNRKYPTNQGAYLNFTIELYYNITNHISIGYEHISNGFGLLHDLNPGVDNFSLKISL